MTSCSPNTFHSMMAMYSIDICVPRGYLSLIYMDIFGTPHLNLFNMKQEQQIRNLKQVKLKPVSILDCTSFVSDPKS